MPRHKGTFVFEYMQIVCKYRHMAISNFVSSPRSSPSRIRRDVSTRVCDYQTPGVYQPFFELYVDAVCMQPVYGANGPPECMEALVLPPMETQMEIVDTIKLYGLVLDVEPIKGLLVRLMMADNVDGFQAAIEAIKEHYVALEKLQYLVDQFMP